jgi:dipeptidase
VRPASERRQQISLYGSWRERERERERELRWRGIENFNPLQPVFKQKKRNEKKTIKTTFHVGCCGVVVNVVCKDHFSKKENDPYTQRSQQRHNSLRGKWL